jgi:hypothetical protein
MGFKDGQTVIVTAEGVNKVGVVLSRRLISKITVYDVLLEDRSVLVMLNTALSSRNYINKILTAKLCDTDALTTTIPYKELVANEQLPFLDANSSGKASW